jgi:subtilase family serine protease
VKQFFLSVTAVIAVGLLTACNGGSMGRSMLPAQPEQITLPAMPAAQFDLLALQAQPHRACAPAQPGAFACDMIVSLVALGASKSGEPVCAHQPGCYGPSDIQAAYGLTQLAKTKGKGVTVAAVDAYGYEGGYKGISKDLATYRKAWGLPACGKGCFKVVNEHGTTALPKPGKGENANWQGEEALDIDMISAACPNCKILLVQANTENDSDLITVGMATALRLADIVSNSFGGPEQTISGATVGWTFYDSDPHKVITASAGDDGAGFPSAAPEVQPCGYVGVVCVGGTSLTVKNGKYAKETVWDGLNHGHECGADDSPCATGSGCSALVAKPSWQTDTGCTMRSAADISANADPYTGVAVVCKPCGANNSSGGPFSVFIGGTSEASPLIAGMYGLAGNSNALTHPSQTLWSKGNTSAFHVISSGDNDKKGITGLVCTAAIAYICKAGTHMHGDYSGPTGWGSPNGVGAL